ncbi:hypothetical protein U9M48_025144 [Paspalum notatum var. saurae]|uniref:Uncharacterized protein n=1 Tax=Paspalum notatum var. saurae TaxID=547442 RepID=A0AAQ3TSP4_PASNO
MSSSPAWAVNGRSTSSSSTTFTTTATGWHDFKVGGYSYLRGLGIARRIKSSTFVVGGHSWCITFFPDGLSHTDTDWICFGLRLEHHGGGGGGDDVMVRTKYTLLDLQVGEPSYTRFSSNVCTFSRTVRSWATPRFIKRDEFVSSYVTDDVFCVRRHVTVLDAVVHTHHQPPPATTVPQPPPPPDMHRHLGDLLAGGVGEDVTLEAGGETFAAHKIVLAARSPVFRAAFFGGPMKEKATGHVRIDGIEPAVFDAVLRFIYTDTFPEMELGDRVAMAQHLLVAADRYDLQRLKSMCEYVLCICVSASVAVTTLVLAEKHGCHQLKQECFRILKNRDKYKEVLVGDDFDSPAWDADSSGSSSTTFATTVAAGWHVLEVHYSRSQSHGNISWSTFVVGGHRCCITYVPDDGLSVDDDADWIRFRLQFTHSAAAGMVRSKHSLLGQAGEASCYLNDGERVRIKRQEFESCYVRDDGLFCIGCDVTVLVVSTRVLATVPPPPDMRRHIGELIAGGGVGADVTLEVGGEAFPAHKVVLAARSSVFRAEFFGGGGSSLVKKDNAAATAAARRVRIDGIHPDVFRAMLHFIYTDTLPAEIERGNRRVMARLLLVAANRYGLERLKSMCERMCCAAVHSLSK